VLANVSSIPDLSTNTTTDLNEGNNLYYTNARVLAHLAESNVSAKSFISTGAGTPSLVSETSLILSANGTNGGAVVIQSSPIRIKSYSTTDRGNIFAANGDLIFNSTKQLLEIYSGNVWRSVGSIDLSGNTTTDLAEGNNLYYTNARVGSYLSENDVTVQSLTVQGDLLVQGNTTTLNTSTVIVEDKNIVLANGSINAAAADGAGITIDGAQANIIYVSTGDKFSINKSLDVQGFRVLTANSTTSDLIEGANLYYTNARVQAFVEGLTLSANLSASTTDDLNEGNVNLYYTNARVQAYLDGATLSANLSGSTTDDLTEGNVNLYYTNTRSRAAFTAGTGITITPSGIIRASDTSESFNLSVSNSTNYIVTDTLANALVLPTDADPAVRYILRSLHITNISEDTAFISGNLIFNGNTEVAFADLMPIPYGTSLEMLLRPQAFSQADRVLLQGFNASGTPTSNLICATFTYESIDTKSGLAGSGNLMQIENVQYQVLDCTSTFAILESIRLVNLDDAPVRSRVTITDANNIPLGYLAYNLALPAKTSVEIIQSVKRINIGEKLFASLTSNANVSAIISYRLGGSVELETFSSSYSSGSNVTILFDTEIEDGTTLYYTIE
jgi:hypothetical protein